MQRSRSVLKNNDQFYFNIITIFSTVYGLQMLRMLFPSFVGYLRDSVGFDSITLAPIALGLFSLVFLAGPLYKLVKIRLYYLFTVGGLVLVRILEQLSTSALFDLILSSLGVAFFLFFLPIANRTSHTWQYPGKLGFGICLLLGVAIDTALLAGYRTMDISWQSGFLPILIILIFGLILLGCLYLFTESSIETPVDVNWLPNLPLISFGAWLFMQMIVFQNIPRLSAITGFETPGAAAVVILGNAGAIFLVLWIFNRKSRFFLISLASAFFLIISQLILHNVYYLSAVLILIGQISCSVLFIFLHMIYINEGSKDGIKIISILYGFSYLLFIALMFLYYLTFDIDLGFRAQALLPLASFFISIGGLSASLRIKPMEKKTNRYSIAIVSFVLILVPIILQIVWKSPKYIQPDPENRSLKVMTYNLHNGFNTDGRLNLEALATLIEESGADVIGLQEISRGWLIWGGVDMLTWLSQRLNMPYISGPTADQQWGNAVLSRYPLTNIRLIPLPPDDLLIRRGFIQTQVDIGDQTINLMVTHFYHLDDNSEIRVLQSTEIIKYIQPGEATILVGDFNATPDSMEMQMLKNSGMIDIASVLGTPPTYTFYSKSPERQIDYIWISNVLVPDRFEIIKTTASDHFPVFSTIKIP